MSMAGLVTSTELYEIWKEAVVAQFETFRELHKETETHQVK
jgi:hypothetical protein